MNYFIDFDNTLYETSKLVELIFQKISIIISEKNKINNEIILKDLKDNYNSSMNIFNFATNIANKYKVDGEVLIREIKKIIDNGENLVFDDVEEFLKKLKEKRHNIYLLTYITQVNMEYQMEKITGSGLAKYFDNIIIASNNKYELDINYKDGIFIDDNPKDIEGLYKQKPIKVIRIRRENNKYSKIDINNDDIEEYKLFKDIKI